MKRFLSLTLGLVLLLALLVGCQENPSGQEADQEASENTVEISKEEDLPQSQEEKPEESQTRTVVDHAGNTVEIPAKIERIVIDQIPILSTYMAYHQGEAPYIVGYAGSLKEVISDTVLKDIAPELLDADTTVHAQGDINIEEIMRLDPDLIFYNASNKQHYEVLSKTGIPCVGFATVGHETPADPIDRYVQWLKLLEEVFGEEGKTDDFIAYGQEIVQEVEERVDQVPQDQRPTAMVLWKYNQGVPMVSGAGVFGDFWLQRIKTPNVAQEVQGFAQTSFEQIYNWDPDILFLDGPGLLDISTQQVYDNSVEGADFSPLSAVKNQRVYNTKLGMWNWFTPNPDGPLVLAWLAQSAYPDEFADYPLKEEIKTYYKKWYNYQLTDDQVEDMFSI